MTWALAAVLIAAANAEKTPRTLEDIVLSADLIVSGRIKTFIGSQPKNVGFDVDGVLHGALPDSSTKKIAILYAPSEHTHQALLGERRCIVLLQFLKKPRTGVYQLALGALDTEAVLWADAAAIEKIQALLSKQKSENPDAGADDSGS